GGRASRGGGLLSHAGWGRYRQRLPLRSLALVDPAGPQGAVFRWNDFNDDGRFQADERGPLLARLDPATLDPGLRAPYTDEVLAGPEAPEGAVLLRFTGNEQDLLEPVNIGVPASRYRVTTVPDPGGDIVGTTEQQQLPLYDRRPASFGADQFVLTNPAEHQTLYEGAELTLERPFGAR